MISSFHYSSGAILQRERQGKWTRKNLSAWRRWYEHIVLTLFCIDLSINFRLLKGFVAFGSKRDLCFQRVPTMLIEVKWLGLEF